MQSITTKVSEIRFAINPHFCHKCTTDHSQILKTCVLATTLLLHSMDPSPLAKSFPKTDVSPLSQWRDFLLHVAQWFTCCSLLAVYYLWWLWSGFLMISDFCLHWFGFVISNCLQCSGFLLTNSLQRYGFLVLNCLQWSEFLSTNLFAVIRIFLDQSIAVIWTTSQHWLEATRQLFLPCLPVHLSL